MTRLETIIQVALSAQTFALKDDTAGLATLLDETDPEFVGFAVEGAAMGSFMKDHRKGEDTRVAALWAGPWASYAALIYAGIGLGHAENAVPVMDYVEALDDPMAAFAIDGFGFQFGFVAASEYLGGQPARLDGDAARLFDVGLGRILWFNSGADPKTVVAALGSFDAARLDDLYAGVGFAATYAGGLDEDGLNVLLDASVRHRRGLAVGSALAVHVRSQSGNPTDASGAVCKVLSGIPADEADALCRETRPGNGPVVPTFLAWREAVTTRL